MWFFNFKKWLRSRKANPPKSLSFRPELQQLEDRTVPSTLYGITSLQDLVSINPDTGAAAVIGNTGTTQNSIISLTADPTGELIAYARHSYGLVQVDAFTGNLTQLLPPFPTQSSIDGLDFDSEGTLFGIDAGTDELFTINLTTGIITVVGPTGIGFGAGIEFDAFGNLFAIDQKHPPILKKLDTSTGAGTFVASLPDVIYDGITIDASSGMLFSSQRLTEKNGNVTSRLVMIDPLTGEVTVVGLTGLTENLVALAFVPDQASLPLADLIAYRPVNDYLYYPSYPVAEISEASSTLGPGIRINGDDDNGNGIPDFADASATAADNDLIRVEVSASGNFTTLTFTENLKVWTSGAKEEQILSGAAISDGTIYVEYVSTNHTTDATQAVMTLTSSNDAGTATDKLVFHSFQSIVIAIGGLNEDPALVGDPDLGVFTIAAKLYEQGYDVHMFKHEDVLSSGEGAAYDEVVSAVTDRNVEYVAIYGHSWGGGATYELANGLQASTLIEGNYTLSYSAYIDAVTHGTITAERDLPPGTEYHDNIFQQRRWRSRTCLLVRGDSVQGAVNLNVNDTTWGKKLNHCTIDNHPMVHEIIISNLTVRVVR